MAAAKKAKGPKFPGKVERMEMAKKQDKTELEIYLELCAKFGREPAASAAKRAKQLKAA